MQENFTDIFGEYYSTFRGQATAIPGFTDPEYKIAIRLANNSIRKWARADGVLWRELIGTLQTNTQSSPALTKTVTGSIIVCPKNMRKPPSKVRFYTGSTYADWDVIDPQNQKDYTDLSGYVWFIGGANSGYSMYIGGTGATQFSGWNIDYVYATNPVKFTTATDPATQIPEMSDINFIIQNMIVLRSGNERNGFVYKTANVEAQTSLANMKIENNSGTFGGGQMNAFDTSSWGAPSGNISGISLH